MNRAGQLPGPFRRLSLLLRENGMLHTSVADKLEAIVGKDDLFTKKADLLAYGYDAAAGAGMTRKAPDMVVLPSSTEEV